MLELQSLESQGHRERGLINTLRKCNPVKWVCTGIFLGWTDLRLSCHKEQCTLWCEEEPHWVTPITCPSVQSLQSSPEVPHVSLLYPWPLLVPRPTPLRPPPRGLYVGFPDGSTAQSSRCSSLPYLLPQQSAPCPTPTLTSAPEGPTLTAKCMSMGEQRQV